MEKDALIQPLMMRRDYGKDDEKKKKDAMMIKEVPIRDYDSFEEVIPPATSCLGEAKAIEDYDSHGCNSGCNKGCFMCDR